MWLHRTVVLVSAAASFSAGAFTISLSGYGPVQLGMSVEAAEKALKTPLYSETNDPALEASCTFLIPKDGHEGVSFMVQKNKIVRVDVDSGTTKTVSGAGIGFPQASLSKLYSGLQTTPHVYTDGHYATLWSADQKRGLVFEIEEKFVSQFRVGFSPQVQLVEGCS